VSLTLLWFLFSDLGPHAQSIVSTRARILGEEERFLDPRSKTSFLFDHLSLVRPLYSHHIFRLQSRLFRRKLPIHKPTNPTRHRSLSGTRCASAHIIVLIRFSFRRSALETSTLQYLSSHYNDGTASVFANPDNETSFIVQIVANKYNPLNFW